MDTDIRHQLIEGSADVPRIGSVIELPRKHLPYAVVSSDGELVEPTTGYLTDLALNDNSPLTVRSYAYDLLRWFRVLWFLDQPWDKAEEADAAAMVGWLRTTANPQRRRTSPNAPPPGSVNIKTGKPYLNAGYQPTTINHSLTVVSGFYAYHQHFGRGPLVNPVPVSIERRRALAHHNPMEPNQGFRRARLRQRERQSAPRAISDVMWDSLIEAMGCDRDRALLLLYVSSGARASELLGIGLGDVDWSGQRLYVITKGTRLREPVPADARAFILLGNYLDEAGVPPQGESLWRTRRGEDRPLTYWAMRRILQRANARLDTNWTLHDLRHTAATRMANDPALTLNEVRAILRHANISTTGRYLHARVEDLFNQLQAHYGRPRREPSYPAGYAPEDVKAVFGG
ncbi:site-specific integrase [Streptomyces sp. NBC_00347]|uniref:tyrosine-type recombinase/integrase n=1 Tax=Streptomyces sp. NBC_00347 TaxID=2975721 RepID=UPI0022584C27|nr:site-specific integrase [Streptomyces sp. NBC_00347]MCX5125375.1 site-specific integrase [Streptomyces sp. NBC_00347]